MIDSSFDENLSPTGSQAVPFIPFIPNLRYYNPTAPAGTPDVLNLSYDYTSAAQAGNNGQIQAIHYFTTPGVEDQTKSESFTYDAWTRLAQAQTLNQTSTGTWNLQWTYDRLGNRLSQGGTGNGVTIGQAGGPPFLPFALSLTILRVPHPLRSAGLVLRGAKGGSRL